MADTRIIRHARVLVDYCLAVRPGWTVGVTAGPAAAPLVTAIYERILERNAFAVIQMPPDGLDEILMRKGKPRHFSTLMPYQRAYAETVDATIRVYAQTNTRALSSVLPEREAALARTHKPISEVLQRKPWVLTLHPTAAYAQDASMGLAAFEDFVYGAMFADRRDPVGAWAGIRRRQAGLIAKLRGADRIRLVGPGTDLQLSVRGRRFVNSDGRRNMPSGEVFTAPRETSAEGVVTFDYPICRQGREVDGVRLVFRKGRVVEAHAEKGNDFLQAMLRVDDGATRLGELGIGTHPRIDRFIKQILFDEKIGGTVHLALGRSPLLTGGKNDSAIHWDLIKDLRRGGSITVDGKVFQRDGRFV